MKQVRLFLLALLILGVIAAVGGYMATHMQTQCVDVYKQPCDDAMMRCLFAENFLRQECIDLTGAK